MIALFYIHSHTTFLSALGTIRKLDLSFSNIVVVTTRHYKVNRELLPCERIIDLSDHFVYLMKNKYNIIRSIRRVRELDDILDKAIGGEYVSFLPHIGVYLMQIIATHRLCKEVNFIEEGSASYSRKLQAKNSLVNGLVKTFISKILIPSKRFWLTDVLFTDLYKCLNIRQSFGIFEGTFQYLPYNKNVIAWPKIALGYEINDAYPIYIFDALVEMNFVEETLYFASLKDMIQETASGTNYIKFHPYQSEKNKNYIREQFNSMNVKVIELPDNVIIEDVIVNKRKLSFFGFSSSILLYAKIFNHQYRSFEYLLKNDSKYINFRKLYDFEL
jgi:hypothetical protein